MRTVYIDSEFKCHIINDGTMAMAESDFFDNKCDTFIEGYRFVPEGESWTREDGVEFCGEMIAPWVDFAELDEAQIVYDRQILHEFESALTEIETALGV